MEVIQFNEELGKKTNFAEITKWMRKEASMDKKKVIEAGGSCCEKPEAKTPEGVISKQLVPMLNECLF